MARPTGRDIRNATLDEATRAIRSAGVTGFSYGDLADRLGVKAPSLHHHFPHKRELVTEAVARYRAEFRAAANELTGLEPIDRLRGYGQLFLEPARQDVLCLCGAAVAGWDALNAAGQAEVTAFFADETRWLAEQIAEGQNRGEIRVDRTADDLAITLLTTLEGTLLISRATAGSALAERVTGTVLELLAPPPARH